MDAIKRSYTMIFLFALLFAMFVAGSYYLMDGAAMTQANIEQRMDGR